MKKILSVLLSCILAVAFSACDFEIGLDELDSIFDDIPSFDDISLFDDLPSFDGKKDKTNANPDILKLQSTAYHQSNYQTKVETEVYTKYNKVYLTEEYAQKYPALNTALNTYTAENERNCLDSYHSIENDVRNTSFGDMKLFDESTLYVRRADKNILSLINCSESYSGGAHGYSALIGVNFDTTSGQKLLLSNVVSDTNALADQIYSEVIKTYGEYLFDASSTLDYIKQNINTLSFVLEYNGLTVIFNPYEIAPYSTGIIDIFIPYEEVIGLTLTKVTDVPISYASELPRYCGYRCNSNGSGIYKEVSVSVISSEYDMVNESYIYIDNAPLKITNPAYDVSAVYIHTAGGKDFVNMKFEYDDACAQISIYEIGTSATLIHETDDYYKVTYSEARGSECDILTDPGCYYAGHYFSVMSTVNAYREVYINELGIPTPTDESGLYTIYDDLVLTLKKSLNADVINEKNGNVKKSITLDPGETLTYYRTDGQRISDFKRSNGQIVRIEIDSPDSWPRTVNGEDIENIFDGVLFAG